MNKEEMYQRFLEWRNIEKPCRTCGGSGVKMYGDTSTYMGGIGGQAMTTDICDKCWGTGDMVNKGVNLRGCRGCIQRNKAEV